MRLLFYLATTAIACGAGLAHAQERAAASALETQMTWSGLGTQIKAAADLATGANTRINQLQVCNSKGLLYAPQDSDAVNGCVEIDALKKLQKRMDQAEKSILTINDSLEKLDTRVGKVEEGFATLTKRVDALAKRVDATEDQIATLDARIDRINTLIKELTVRVADNEQDVKMLTEKVVSINAQIKTLKTDLDALEVDVDKNTSDIKNIVACNKLGKVYNGTDCIAQSKRTSRLGTRLDSFQSESSSNATVTKTYTIPANANTIALRYTCWVKGSSAGLNVKLEFDKPSNVPYDTICYMRGNSNNQTLSFGSTKYIRIPEGAETYTITKESDAEDNKAFVAEISFFE